MASQKDTVRDLLDRHGRTSAEELKIDVAKGTPSALYRLLCAAMLMSARIDSRIATEAARSTRPAATSCRRTRSGLPSWPAAPTTRGCWRR